MPLKRILLTIVCVAFTFTCLSLPKIVEAQSINSSLMDCGDGQSVCNNLGAQCIDGRCFSGEDKLRTCGDEGEIKVQIGKPCNIEGRSTTCKEVKIYGEGDPSVALYCWPQNMLPGAPAQTLFGTGITGGGTPSYSCNSTQGGIDGMYTLFGDAILIALRAGAIRFASSLPSMAGALISRVPILGGIGEAIKAGAEATQKPLLNTIDFLSAKWLGAMVWGLIATLANWVVSLLMGGAIALNSQISKDNLPLLYGYNFSLTLANFGLLIGVIAIGFGTILGNKGLNFRQTLVRLIIAAILINFSWFFTTFAADIGTRMTEKMYDLSINNTAANPIGFFGFLNTRCFINRIYYNCTESGGNITNGNNIFDSQGNVILNDTDADRALISANPQTEGTAETPSVTPSLTSLLFSLTVWPYLLTIISSLFSIIGSLTYAVLFLFLLIRYGILILLIIVAPLVWILYVFPQIKIKGVSVDSWMNSFFEWVLYGPIIVFFLILSSKYIEFASQTTVATCGGATIAVANLLVPLIISLGGLFMTSKMSAVGSGLIMAGVSFGLTQASGFLQNVTGTAKVRAERRYKEELERAGGDRSKVTAYERRVKTFEALSKAVQLQAPLGMPTILKKTGVMKSIPRPIEFTKEQKQTINRTDILRALDPRDPSFDQTAILQLTDDDAITIMADTSPQGVRNNRNLDNALQALLLQRNAGTLNPNQLNLLNKFNRTAITRAAIAGYTNNPQLLAEIKSDAFYQLSPEIQDNIKSAIKAMTPKTDKDSIKLLSKIDGNILATTIAEQIDAGVTDINIMDKLGSLNTDSIKTLKDDTKKSLVKATQALLIDANSRNTTSKVSREALTKLDGASDEFVRKAVLAEVSTRPTLIAELKENHLKGLSVPEKEIVIKTTEGLLRAATDAQSPVRTDSQIALARANQDLRRDSIFHLAEQTGNEIFITELKSTDLQQLAKDAPQKLEQAKTVIEKLIPQLVGPRQRPLTGREQIAKEKLRRMTGAKNSYFVESILRQIDAGSPTAAVLLSVKNIDEALPTDAEKIRKALESLKKYSTKILDQVLDKVDVANIDKLLNSLKKR